MVHYSRVINGLITYISKDIAGSFTGGWENWIIKTFAGLAYGKSEKIFRTLAKSPIIAVLDLVDGENVDIEAFLAELKKHAQQGTATVNLPVVGPVTFSSGDVDALHRYIMGG